MTQTAVPRQSATPATPRPLAAFARFVVCGGGVGLVSSGVVVLLASWLPFAAANALITIASTVVATELHGRFTFGAARTSWRQHLRSGLTVAAGFLVTTAAVLGLHAIQPEPGMLLEQTVYLVASGLAGIGRFLVLRAVVFAQREPGCDLDREPGREPGREPAREVLVLDRRRVGRMRVETAA